MLHYETIDPKTLELLKKLQKVPAFSELRLAGGTSLALQLGHRKSIDLDLFGNIQSDEYAISEALNTIGKVTILRKSENINIFLIDNIKVDIVNYHYPWIEKSINEDDLTLAGERDIAAMKLSAITGRGTKKDFIDLFFLLQSLSLDEILAFYNQKYHDGSEFLVLKSLSYFEDADEDEDPVMLHPFNWNEIKEFIKKKLKDYLQTPMNNNQ